MSRLSMILLDEEALDLEVTEEVAPEEVAESAIEVIDDSSELSQDISTSDDMGEVVETLEGLYASAKLLHTEGFSKSAVAMLAVGLDSIERRTGGAYAIKSVVNYSSESIATEEYSIMMESMGEHIKKAITQFVLLLKKIAISLSTFFLKLFNSAPKIESRAKELIKTLKSLDKASSEGEVKCDAKWLMVDKKFDPSGTVVKATQRYVKTTKELSESSKKYTNFFHEIMALPNEPESIAKTSEIIARYEAELKKDEASSEATKESLASHVARTVKGVTVYTLINVSVENKQKCLSKNDAIKLLGEVATLANSIATKKGVVKDINKAVADEITAISKLASGNGLAEACSVKVSAAQKMSVKKQANSLNNAANFSFRVAIAGLRLGEACAKKLGGKDPAKEEAKDGDVKLLGHIASSK